MDPLAITSVITLLASSLKSLKWLTEDRTSPTRRRPNIVATTPDGTKYVIEVQAGDQRPRFGELAQVENLANGISASSGGDPVHPILVTDQPVSDSVSDAAKAVGIDIVKVAGSPEQIAVAITEHLLHYSQPEPQLDV